MTQIVSRGLERLPPALPKSVAGMARTRKVGRAREEVPRVALTKVLLPVCCKNWSGPAEELGLSYSPLIIDPGVP
jgi:hypothetical protein